MDDEEEEKRSKGGRRMNPIGVEKRTKGGRRLNPMISWMRNVPLKRYGVCSHTCTVKNSASRSKKITVSNAKDRCRLLNIFYSKKFGVQTGQKTTVLNAKDSFQPDQGTQNIAYWFICRNA